MMKRGLSIYAANGLFLICIVLILTVGSVIQTLNLTLGLIGTELLLILLPAILFLRVKRIPLKEGLRLNPIKPGVAALCVLLGISTFLFSIIIESIMAQLTGMTSVSLPAGSMPKGIFFSALYFIALAVAAPVCEEALFRGAIQGAYERQRSAAFAISITALMFALFHMRLSGLPGLIPVSFILCFVVWRTQSLYAGMLVHFGVNAMSAANTLVALNINNSGLPMLSGWISLGGLAAAAGLLYLLVRLQPAPANEAAPETIEAAPKKRTWLGNYWPLLGGGVLYLAVAGLTLVVSLYPELTASSQVTYTPPKIAAPLDTRYQITNRAGEAVGELKCRVAPQEGKFSLDCSGSARSYEAHLGSSTWIDREHTLSWSAAWDAQTVDLLSYSFERKQADGGGYRVELRGKNLAIEQGEDSSQVLLPDDSLVAYEWLWRAGVISSDAVLAYKVPFGYLQKYDASLGKSLPILQTELLRLYPVDTVTVPAGHFETWKANLGGQTAWYARNEQVPGGPVQFDDGMVVYQLVK
jgi:membrane protease YdiL (CAAX protease family)